MKKFIRDILDDLNRNKKPEVAPAVPDDLQNQELSKNPAEKVRQLDFQAQQDERRETNS
jgi:hypothetical protein